MKVLLYVVILIWAPVYHRAQNPDDYGPDEYEFEDLDLPVEDREWKNYLSSPWYHECGPKNPLLCGNGSDAYPQRHRDCHCDQECFANGDCCLDKLATNTKRKIFSDERLQCLPLPTSPDPTYGVYMVAQCDPLWPNATVRSYCERKLEEGFNISHTLPLYSDYKNRFYKNVYCAICNHEHRWLTTWTLENLECMTVNSSFDSLNFITEKCVWKVREFNNLPDFELKFRPRSCVVGAISTCGDRNATCPQYYAPIIFQTPNGTRMYQNYQCAECNHVDEKANFTVDCTGEYREPGHDDSWKKREISCLECYHETGQCRGCYARRDFWYQMRVFRTVAGQTAAIHGRQTKISTFRNPILMFYNSTISNSTETISNIFFAQNFLVAIKDEPHNFTSHKAKVKRPKTVNIAVSTDKSNSELNRTLVVAPWGKVLNPDQYELYLEENGRLVLHWAEKDWVEATYINSNYGVITTMHIVCHSLSVICLGAQLVVYSILPTLRNLPGKIVMSISVSLACGNVAYALGYYLTHNHSFCYFLGVVQHYAYLAVFVWTNVLAIIVTHTFVRSNGAKRQVETGGRYFKYSMYAWGAPTVIVLTAIVLDWVLEESSSFKPNYAQGACFMTRKWPIIVFSSGPIALLLACNVLLFVVTARNWYLSSQDTRMVNQDSFRRFLKLSVKLAAILGLSWLFGFVAVVSEVREIFHPFVMITELQGVFLFVALTCKADVWKLLTKKYGSFEP